MPELLREAEEIMAAKQVTPVPLLSIPTIDVRMFQIIHLACFTAVPISGRT